MCSLVLSLLLVSSAFARPDANECETVVSDLLQRKKEALDRRERTINVREKDLLTAENRIQAKLDDLSAMRKELRDAMTTMDAQQEQEAERLAGMFQKMRDKQAAAILEQIEESAISVSILRRLPRAKAGTIMAAMNKKKAAELAEMMTKPPSSR